MSSTLTSDLGTRTNRTHRGSIEKIAIFAAKFLVTGSHDESVKELLEGRFDAVCVANDLLARMYAKGAVKGQELKPERVRSVFKSDAFPPLCFSPAAIASASEILA